MAYPYCYPSMPHAYPAYYQLEADPSSQVFAMQPQMGYVPAYISSPTAVTPHTCTTNITNVLVVNNHRCTRRTHRFCRNGETIAPDLAHDHDEDEPFIPDELFLPNYWNSRAPTSVSNSDTRRDRHFALAAAPAPSYSGSEFNGQALHPGPHLSLYRARQSHGRHRSDMYASSSRMPRTYYEGGHPYIEELSSQYDSEGLEPDEELQEDESRTKKEQSFVKKLKSVFGKNQ